MSGLILLCEQAHQSIKSLTGLSLAAKNMFLQTYECIIIDFFILSGKNI
jgi:hypothetical protein